MSIERPSKASKVKTILATLEEAASDLNYLLEIVMNFQPPPPALTPPKQPQTPRTAPMERLVSIVDDVREKARVAWLRVSEIIERLA